MGDATSNTINSQNAPNASSSLRDYTKDPQMKNIVMRFKQCQTQEERHQVFHELKKTPHLFSAFQKMRLSFKKRMTQQNPRRDGSQQQQPARAACLQRDDGIKFVSKL